MNGFSANCPQVLTQGASVRFFVLALINCEKYLRFNVYMFPVRERLKYNTNCGV